MGYFFTALTFPENSRMTGVSVFTFTGARVHDTVAMGHLVALPPGQAASIEADFLTAHLPFRAGAFWGAFPNGDAFVFLLQQAAAGITENGDELDPKAFLEESLARALDFNRGAEVLDAFLWTRADLLAVYDAYDVEQHRVADWSIFDLLQGLLAQCCLDDLDRIVTGQGDGSEGCDAIFTAWSAWQDKR